MKKKRPPLLTMEDTTTEYLGEVEAAEVENGSRCCLRTAILLLLFYSPQSGSGASVGVLLGIVGIVGFPPPILFFLTRKGYTG